MRKLAVSAVVWSVLFFGVHGLRASGPLGVYAIVDKVVFEPNETAPQRIQVWGVFSVAPYSADGTSNPSYSPVARGYLYYTLPAGPAQAATARKEWADLKAIAGTGQAVAFGSGWNPARDLRVRPSTEAPTAPFAYTLNTGIVKLSNAGTNANMVKQLKDAAARK